ncbi:glycosyltransferase family 1 protein [Novosphingobium sp.]|uniref:glycosyltransferase family 4 protein n=1 Tax=Novosphingobium sp. TaxID=1874826 RepID=UPI003342642B
MPDEIVSAPCSKSDGMRPDLAPPDTLLPVTLLDVSRLVWRRWAGRLPTGIDRVCLAYLDRFGGHARAVLQWRGHVRVLSPRQSARLFDLIAHGGPGFRRQFVAMLPAIAVGALGAGARDLAGARYFNVGHTGLDQPALPRWIIARRLRAVFVLHDLIPITHPALCRAGGARRHERRIRHALTAGAAIIANSAATLAELDAFATAHALPLPPRLPAWIGGVAAHAPALHQPPVRPWFVTVGTIEGRKNHLMLLQVWQRLAQIFGPATPLLIVAGQRGWEAGAALAIIDRDPALAAHVVEIGGADDATLAGLIAGARALLMPSFAEGFGLPVIEALQLGTPVIASNLPVFREIGAGIPMLIDPIDAPAWLAAVCAFRTDGPDRARQIAAMAQYRAPTWDDHFARVGPWLDQILP